MKFLLLFLALVSGQAHAKLLQIIHTNDLHSYFEGERNGLGGYARLKAMVEKLKVEAASKGIPTLYLDGGDFGEGTSHFFADRGIRSFRALDELGVDVTVLGNHDFITGGRDLARLLRKAKLRAKILSANLHGKRLRGLRKLLPSYVDYELDGLKLRIFGLTTNEIHFQYPLLPLSHIAPPHWTGIRQAEKAQRHGVDFLIALTHIGLSSDIRLVSKSRSIDLVVGGHSHGRLRKPVMVKNLEGREVPILQAGAHGLYVGSLLIDVAPEGKSQVIAYRSHRITPEVPEDPKMKYFIEESRELREKYFQRNFDEVIGISEINLSGRHNGNQIDRRTCWSRHISRLTRKLTRADVAIQLDEFQGERIPKGEITFGDMIDNFPHFRRWGDQGWRMARARVNGWVLKKAISLLANSPDAIQITIDGLEVRDEKGKRSFFDLLEHGVERALVDGTPINNFRFYTIGFPSEIPFAFWKTLNVFSFLLMSQVTYLEDTDYWPTMEKYIAENSPIRCLEI